MELVRHRLASFAQESTRYCNYGKEDSITFIIPNWVTCPDNLIDNHLTDDSYNDYICNTEDCDENFLHWSLAVNSAENFYLTAINELKWTPQEARSVLPNSLKTEINMSANLREWRDIFKQRCSPAAHPQMREVMIPLLHEMQAKIPLIFDDIKY